MKIYAFRFEYKIKMHYLYVVKFFQFGIIPVIV